jgi:glycosyltransferase involved in cell wall biosynthesis
MIKNKLLSIVTINKNNARYLEKTIKSIINQSLKIFDLVIIDGKSSDKSVNIIRKYSNKISYWSSSRDVNIADAFNKGISQCKSSWILFINSDDYLVNNHVMTNIYANLLAFKNYDMLIYKIILKSRDLKKTKGIFGGFLTKIKKIKFYNTIPHQATIINKNYFMKYGNYSLDYPIAQDYEIILRSKKIKIKKIDKIISVMRDGGITNTNQLTSLKYFMKAQIKNKTNKIYLCIMIYIYGIFKVILKIILNKLKLINIL